MEITLTFFIDSPSPEAPKALKEYLENEILWRAIGGQDEGSFPFKVIKIKEEY